MRFGIAEAVSYHETRQTAQPARAAAEGRTGSDAPHLTEGRAERDVHVDGIPAGAFVMVAGTSVLVATWVDVGGHVVEVRRGR
ncbi:hypothetical protein BH11MYX4_BH11MYX4_50790 [soil metagenome]